MMLQSSSSTLSETDASSKKETEDVGEDRVSKSSREISDAEAQLIAGKLRDTI